LSLHRAPICAQCGSLNCRLVEGVSTADDVVKISGHLCEPCLYAAKAQAKEFQRQFDDMLGLGVSRELANEVMIDRVDRFYKSVPKRKAAP
jgi:hypothetical protein